MPLVIITKMLGAFFFIISERLWIMTNTDMVDFDAMFAEDVVQKPHEYKLFGEVGTIPPSLPYGIVMLYQRLAKANEEDEVQTNSVHEMLCMVFGEQVVEKWAKNPSFNIDKMTKVLKWAMSQYGLAAKESEAPKVNRGKLRVVKSE